MTKLDEFEAEAARLGATVERFKLDPAVREVQGSRAGGACRMTASAPNGGCGLGHCRCSPGLWVSVFEDENTGACAHFGEDWQRGGVGAFSVNDFHQWEKLVRFTEQLVARPTTTCESASEHLARSTKTESRGPKQ